MMSAKELQEFNKNRKITQVCYVTNDYRKTIEYLTNTLNWGPWTILKNNQIIFTLKNISAQPLNIPVEELTERFIRGDVARNTEGSGLGLSIAQSLTQLQGGTFNLYLDGDLFKVCLSFPQKISPTALSGPDESHS